MLREGGFDGLYRMEIAILPKEQAAYRRQEPVGLPSVIEVAGYQFSGLVHPLSLVQEHTEFRQQVLRRSLQTVRPWHACGRDVEEAVKVDAHRGVEYASQ